MEGRDIALRVLPNAQLKIYLTATVEERSKRRHADWLAKGYKKTYESTLEDTKIRDMQDMTRSVDPLQKVEGVWELDTTGMTQTQVIDTIVQELQKRGLQ
jgi:cytidylate kinase